MYPILVVYFTNRNEFIVRLVSNVRYHENDITSMGWKVVSIRYYYRGNFIKKETLHDYILYESFRRYDMLKRKKRLEKVLRLINSFFK